MIERNKLITALLKATLFLSPYCVSAAIFHDIDTTTPLKCTLSSSHQNRVIASGGRIAKAIFPDNRISVQIEDESGQIFIYALGPIANETTVSVVTENGYVQDLEIRFEDKSSEVVILNEPNEKCKDESPNQMQAVPILIDEILQGNIPKGYCCFRENGENRKIRKGIVVETLARFEGESDIIYLYKVINRMRSSVCIHEQQLSLPCGLWVFLERNSICPKEETIAIVAVKR